MSKEAFKVLWPGGTFRPPAGAPTSVPWALIAPYADRAERNHHQTLERLQERGGLCPAELIAVLEDRPYRRIDADEALERLKALVAAFNAGAMAAGGTVSDGREGR